MLSKQERDFFEKGLDAVRTKVEIFKEEESQEFTLSSPKEIYSHLDRFVVGQEKAKKVLSVVAHNHYKRLLIWKESGFKRRLDKTNAILLGPTGSGKTFMVKKLAEFLEVPCYVADANSLTAAGYVGKDAESIVEGLIAASGDNYDAAATGIIFIDEFDKIAKKGVDGKKKDIGGESVQQALLKIIEGTVLDFERNSGLSRVKFSIDTSNILVIVGGAFVGLEEIIEKRMKIKRSKGIGFVSSAATENAPDKSDILQYVKSEDLEHFGFIPEILGRLPLIAPLKELTEQDLVNILSKVENNSIEQYTELLKYSKVDLNISDDAILEMAKLAKTLGTGARSLKTIMENVLLDHMFDLEEANITADDVKKLYTQLGYDSKAEANQHA